jgi:hypothetical protein
MEVAILESMKEVLPQATAEEIALELFKNFSF